MKKRPFIFLCSGCGWPGLWFQAIKPNSFDGRWNHWHRKCVVDQAVARVFPDAPGKKQRLYVDTSDGNQIFSGEEHGLLRVYSRTLESLLRWLSPDPTLKTAEDSAETELRVTVKALESKLKAAGAGKSHSENVALAQVFARDSTSAVLKIQRKYGLTDEQADRLLDKVMMHV